MSLKIKICFLLCFLITQSIRPVKAQIPQVPASELQQNLKKLKVLTSVLYVAAHPDDENTLLLAYLSKEKMARTAYLSLTRGDGGQNLIGAEQGYNIGLIRTQELLAARKIDGAEQFFSRAYDFGFSKTKDETLEFWNKEKILGDIVWIIRNYQPDVIITRFPPDERAGHGHHQASGYLAEEAFSISGDVKKFPDQLNYVRPWQATRILWNTYSRGFANEAPTDANKPYLPVELGGFNPLIGKSYTEIAAQSRSQHKSQGFGAAPVRDSRIDYLLHTDGSPARQDLFDGIDTSWKRVPGGDEVEKLINQAIRQFNNNRPAASVPELVKIYQALLKLDERNNYVKQKKEEVTELIRQCLGLWMESTTSDYSVVPGDQIGLYINVLNRSDFPVKLVSVNWTGSEKDSLISVPLTTNQAKNVHITTVVPENLSFSQPYWLEKPIDSGSFQIDDQRQVGPPENHSQTLTSYTFEIAGQRITYSYPWVYKSNDPVEGEVYRPFELRPQITTSMDEQVYIFTSTAPKSIRVKITAHQKDFEGVVKMDAPKNWVVTPESYPIKLTSKYGEETFTFKVTPPAQNQDGLLRTTVTNNNRTFTKSIKSITHRHIPVQTVFPNSEARIARTDVKVTAKKIGYIAGAGDDVPAAIRQMGCTVVLLDEAELAKDLTAYDAIVLGVRAYNTEQRLSYYQDKLLKYVENGGTMVVQYVTPMNMKVGAIGPYPFTIGRDRVTEENAEMRLLAPGHRLLNYPNKLSKSDFDGWIQERGLYFAEKWDPRYQSIFSSNDQGETPKEGSLLYATHGKGHFIYTGLSFFRELPAGVTGAYRLFANLISVGK
jgi:LmbE family N-acetylglucosaminyl deacetylase